MTGKWPWDPRLFLARLGLLLTLPSYSFRQQYDFCIGAATCLMTVLHNAQAQWHSLSKQAIDAGYSFT